MSYDREKRKERRQRNYHAKALRERLEYRQKVVPNKRYKLIKVELEKEIGGSLMEAEISGSTEDHK